MLNTTLDTGTVRATLKTTPLMEAVRFHGPRDIRIETIDEPICGKGQVKVTLHCIYGMNKNMLIRSGNSRSDQLSSDSVAVVGLTYSNITKCRKTN